MQPNNKRLCTTPKKLPSKKKKKVVHCRNNAAVVGPICIRQNKNEIQTFQATKNNVAIVVRKSSRNEVFQCNLSIAYLFHTVIIPTIISLIDRYTIIKQEDGHEFRCLWDCYNDKEFALDITFVIGEGFRWLYIPFLQHLVKIDHSKNVVRWYHNQMPIMWRHINELAIGWGFASSATASSMVIETLKNYSIEEAQAWYDIWRGELSSRSKVYMDIDNFLEVLVGFYDKRNEYAMGWMMDHTLIAYQEPVDTYLNRNKIQRLEEITLVCSYDIRDDVQKVILNIKAVVEDIKQQQQQHLLIPLFG
jgi:hypothetical protein